MNEADLGSAKKGRCERSEDVTRERRAGAQHRSVVGTVRLRLSLEALSRLLSKIGNESLIYSPVAILTMHLMASAFAYRVQTKFTLYLRESLCLSDCFSTFAGKVCFGL